MGRARRVASGGIVYHVLNRANRRARMFHKPGDYQAFLKVIEEGLARIPCRLLGLCLMHYHDKVGGHLYQGRFKSFPVQEDGHLLTVLRYVEANPLRCGLSQSACQWPWSSCSLRQGTMQSLLSEWPLPCPADWHALVEARWAQPELARLRSSVDRGSPFGQEHWVLQTARHLGLESTVRQHGHPGTDDQGGMKASTNQ
jgi:putative transposase